MGQFWLRSQERRSLFFPFALILLMAAPFQAASADFSNRKPAPGDEFFNDGKVHTFKIHVEEAALGVLQKNDRSYVRATVTEGTNVFKDVGIHLKGMGSFRPFNDKPSFSVKFDKYVDDQTYGGLTKLMLNNASQDPTYLAELMATRMFREAGVPAARVTHAFVEVNGRALGLYVVVEAMNKEFLRQYFRNAKGNLYEAYLQDIDQKLDLDGGSDTSQADLQRFFEVCKLEDRLERWKRLHEVLDVDGYVSHLVVELFTSHTDGYAMNRNNYRLYHDPATDRFVFLAHGIDWAFANTGVSMKPPTSSIVTRAVLQTPAGRRQFRERRAELFTNVFRVDVLTRRVDETVARLKVSARNTNEAREFDNHGLEMRNRIVARARFIADEIARPEAPPLQFGTNNSVLLSDWRAEKGKTEGALNQTNLADKATLHLRVDKGEGIISWRKKVLLDEGRYKLQALARTAQVVALTNTVERGNGAGVRVSGDKRTRQLIGDVTWTPLEHEFEVMPGGDEKELICELRAGSGEVWFDAASLRLVRSK
jgi:spore coat protein H